MYEDNSRFLNKICIREGNINQEPCAVVVTGVNSFDYLVCRVINSGSLLMSEVNGFDLHEFDYDKLQLMRYEWNVENAKRAVERCEKNLIDLKEAQSKRKK